MTRDTRIAIIGGGIVGLTTAYYLKQAGFENITIFDEGTGQATKAAAGIISPWLSKRRNKRWYELAKLGAKLYPEIVATAQLTSAAYRQNGTIVTRREANKLTELYELAMERLKTTPAMQQIELLSASEINKRLPGVRITDDGIFVAGGAQIDGTAFLYELTAFLDVNIVHQQVKLTPDGQIIGEANFDRLILATGAWLAQTITPLGLTATVRPQKGQLINYQTSPLPHDTPVLMPEGEYDYLPSNQGVIVGASHEDAQGFDLTIDQTIVNDLMVSAHKINPALGNEQLANVRVGTRAYTPDFAPFFGQLPGYAHIYVASGLGSSGLTTGPAIAKLLAELFINPNLNISEYTKPVTDYIH
ncbi:NAD(P)/FAD-dependent oxidoreductase [Periweissella fabalis]|uniref:FAD-binding oxidoreductase n=1 Tax=Periweissella fabalis TaxID=1070421 RepID=A0A7X6MZX2_9LACO|nr:FAD-dependent oxidoreductase [Periweissella fabalis]MCM0598968.1 FAD-binding oxidoreductase [Periweissella fabalis]NKZ23248.1 FAD-binding oxidoreductase [Periweissella fabalis]